METCGESLFRHLLLAIGSCDRAQAAEEFEGPLASWGLVGRLLCLNSDRVSATRDHAADFVKIGGGGLLGRLQILNFLQGTCTVLCSSQRFNRPSNQASVSACAGPVSP